MMMRLVHFYCMFCDWLSRWYPTDYNAAIPSYLKFDRMATTFSLLWMNG